MANFHVVAELGCENITSTPIATRGERLVLVYHSLTAPAPETSELVFIAVVEINGDNQIVNTIFFDSDQFDAAFAELDARYLAGEAEAFARTWS